MFKSAKNKANIAQAIKQFRVDRNNVSPSEDKFRVPKDELPRGIMQSNGKLKNCK